MHLPNFRRINMQIYYFTRTGESKQIAEQIAQKNGVVARKIDDGYDWDGKLNFIKGGAQAKKKVVATVDFEAPDQNNPIVLVFPLWAGTFPPAVRGFLAKVDGREITAVVLSAATSLNDAEKALFASVYEVKGKDKRPPNELIGI